MKANRIIIAIFILLVLSGCGISPEEVEATVTQAAIEVAETRAAMSTETPIPSATPLPTDTPTPTPNITATLEAIGTDLASYMKADLEELHDDGYLNTTDGEYFLLRDFTESWAQINWVNAYPTGYETADFVLRGEVSWEMASTSGNFKNTGCGFYWGLDENAKNYYVAVLALDGTARVFIAKEPSQYLGTAGSGYYGRIDPMKGSAEIMIIVEEGTIQFFVNGERAMKRENQYELEGFLAYAISSGTNAGFGTRCEFTDFELWTIDN